LAAVGSFFGCSSDIFLLAPESFCGWFSVVFRVDEMGCTARQNGPKFEPMIIAKSCPILGLRRAIRPIFTGIFRLFCGAISRSAVACGKRMRRAYDRHRVRPALLTAVILLAALPLERCAI
jgi:hypothetical protein